MAKIVITNGTIHSDDDFNLTSGSDANTRNNFRICKQKDSHTRLRSLSSFRIKTHDLLNTGNTEICGNLTVHGTCTVLNTTLCLTDTTATDNFTLVSTEAGASAAPDFKLYRNSASPANNDSLGHIKFSGKDAAGNETEYAGIKGCIRNVGSGSECGTIINTVTINGSLCDIFRVEPTGAWMLNNKTFYISGTGQLRNYGANLRFSTGGGDYKMVWEPNSTTKMCLDGGELTVCNKVYTPILRATACTFYGACGSSKLTSSGDNMAHTTQYGVICIGPGNSSYAHIQTDRSQFYFNKQLVVDSGHVLSYNEDLILSRAGNGTNRINIGTARTTSCQPFTIKDSADDTFETGLNIIRSANADSVWINQKGGSTNFNNKNNAGNAGQDYRFYHNGTESVRMCGSSCRLVSFCGLMACNWSYAGSYFQGCRLYTKQCNECFHFCTGNMACNAWMTAGRLYPGGSWQLNSRQGYTIPNTGNATCWLKFGAMCIPQHGYKMLMKVVASNGYGSNTTDTTQETTLLFQTANTGEASSGSSVCACVHSFIEGSTKRESDAPYCFIVHQVNSSFYEFFGKFNTYTGVGSYYTVDHGPSSGWIACNAFVDPDSCSGSCIVSIPNRGTIFCTSSSTTCIRGTAIPQGDICMNNGSRGYKLGTDTAGSGSRAFLVLDSDGSDGIGVGSDYTFIANDGNDTKISNNGPEHIRLCGSSCVAFCKAIATNCIRNHGGNAYLNQYGGCCLIGGVHFRDCQGCTRGYVYHDGAANFGLLSCAGSWAIKITSNSSIQSAYHHCFSCNAIVTGCVQGAVLCGTACVKTPMIQAQGGKSCFSAPAVAADDWACSALHIRERGEVSSAQSHCCYAPNINFHWGGRISNSLWMDAVGALNWGSYNSNGCPDTNGNCRFNTGILYGETCVLGPILCATSCVTGNVIETSGSIVRWCYPSNCGPYLQTGGTYSAPTVALKRHDGSTNDAGFLAGKSCGTCCVSSPIVCGTTCLATNVISSSGSAPSDYGALAIEGNKGGYGGVHFCGTTFMSASDCGGGGIYNDSCNGWVLYYACGGPTYLYYDGSAKLHTLENGVRACKSGCGYMDLCPTGSWGHFITDRTKFYVNKPWIVNTGFIGSYDEDLVLHRGHGNSTAAERITITSGTTHICQYTNVAGKLAVNASGLTCCCALNCGKADFEVCTGGTATAAWSGGRFRVGADDVNWSVAVRQNGHFETYGQNLTLRNSSGNRCIIMCPSGTGFTKVCGNLCVTGQVCADGMQGDEYTTVSVRTTVSCFHPGCVVGRDNVYDIFVSANPNCDGGDYRDIHHIQAYVSTGYSGSAVTTYINSRQVMAVGGYGGSCGATPSTQASVHLVNGSGAHAYEYPISCSLCLGIQLCGGQSGGSNCCRRALECVVVKKIL